MSKELIKRIAREAGITQVAAKQQLKNVFSSLSNELKEKDTVSINNFGSFNKSRFRKKTVLFNKEYMVDTNVIRFNIFEKLKKSIN